MASPPALPMTVGGMACPDSIKKHCQGSSQHLGVLQVQIFALGCVTNMTVGGMAGPVGLWGRRREQPRQSDSDMGSDSKVWARASRSEPSDPSLRWEIRVVD